MTNLTETKKEKEIIALINSAIGDIWSHPKGARGGKDCKDDQCEYCGKKVGGKTNTRFVHILTNGKILPNEVSEREVYSVEELTGEQSQGCFAIGSECVKKVLGKNVDTHSFTYSK